ncbi:ECF RNA polymerase sigma factor SigK [Calidithermus terrae]|uniref:ECF RNA polymerase sigma factor SigK n=1 Tax=Calidithermus terrae TaxID=1408545 RepID=A0A399E6L2_9DEIN|nr:sigma-70 family RNA polymerase sigma factor [Calidithermus terrae]RIH80367.1 ECF RNA polymerase sigma factor SigK [Calidithermus terrae]
MDWDGFPDEALLALVARGEEKALEALYDRYASAMLGLAQRMGFDRDAREDCVQEIFYRIWSRAGSFDGRRATGRSWILAVGHHYCVDRVRREASRPRGLEPSPEEEEAFDLPGPGLDEGAALDRVRVQRALQTLSPDERRVIEALHFRGLTYPEAAKALGWPLGTLKARVGRALAKLREVLREA